MSDKSSSNPGRKRARIVAPSLKDASTAQRATSSVSLASVPSSVFSIGNNSIGSNNSRNDNNNTNKRNGNDISRESSGFRMTRRELGNNNTNNPNHNQNQQPRYLDRIQQPSGTSNSSLVNNIPPSLPSSSSSSTSRSRRASTGNQDFTKLLVNKRQRGNPVLKCISCVNWEFVDGIIPDYVMVYIYNVS